MSEPNTAEAIMAEAAGASAALQLENPQNSAGVNSMLAKFEQGRKEVIEGAEKSKVEAPPKVEAKPEVEVEKTEAEVEKPKEEPVAETVAEKPEIVVPEVVKTPKARDEFKKLEAAKSEAVRRAELAETKIKELETRVGSTEEVERLRAEHKILTDKIRILDLTHLPQFVGYFDKKFSGVKALAESVFGKENVPKIMEILEAPPSRQRNQALTDIIPDSDEYERQALIDLARKHDEIKLERATEIQNAPAYAEKLKEQRAAEQATHRKQLETTFDTVLKKTEESLGLKTKDGDEKWNKEIEQIRTNAKGVYLGNMTPEQAAQASIFAAIAPKQIEIITYQRAEITKLKAQLSALQGATPTIPRGGQTPAAPAANGESDFISKFTGVLAGTIPVPAGRR